MLVVGFAWLGSLRNTGCQQYGTTTDPTKTNSTMKSFFLPAAFTLMSAAATAQSTLVAENTTTPPATTVEAIVVDGHNDCLARTTPEAMTSLGLTPEQMGKVRDIQAAHKKECAAHDASTTAETKAKVADKHEAQVKEVLTSDQYTKWLTWCAEQPAKTEETPKK